MPGAVETGAELDGFTVGDHLHAGAMGDVFRCTGHGLTQPLVMKVPRLGSGEQSESMLGFQTEAAILPRLKGCHVPALIATGDLTRTPYLVLEWIPGTTLEARFAGGPLPAAELAAIGAAVADALHAVHRQTVIHLDVKPTNVILRPDGTAVLIDFGLAHHAELPDLFAEETRFRAGSAPYVSPEQLLGTREDPRSDLFALGVTLYEAATAALPFGEPETDVRNRFWLDPPPPSSLAPEVPPWLQEVILRCLEPSAELRYQSAAHVAFDLREPQQIVLTARATKAKRAGLFAHVQRFLHAHAEHAARLRSPAALPSTTPIVLVAIDTEHLEDERHPAIHFALSQILASSSEFRLLCLSVIAPGGSTLEHLVRLRQWVEPLGLPAERLSLHALEASSPAEAIVELARHNNVDLIVLGAPSDSGRAWAQSVASTVSGKAPCSVHLVRVAKR
jgi:serine/threonine protein kinase